MRFVTAASLFDGHDAAINIMRRILQGMGAEVIHLGHNRSVDEVVTAALQEDVQGIADQLATRAATSSTSSTWSTCCKERGGAHIQVFGGGGGVIVPSEIAELQAYGVARIYSPEDGQRMGLAGMIGEMVMRCDIDLVGARADDARRRSAATASGAGARSRSSSPRSRTAPPTPALRDELRAAAERGARRRCSASPAPAAPASRSLTDELIRRLRLDQDDALQHRRDLASTRRAARAAARCSATASA